VCPRRAYTNPDGDPEVFIEYVRAYGRELGLEIVLKREGVLRERLRFARKLWLWLRRPPPYASRLQRRMQMLDWAYLLLYTGGTGTIIYGLIKEDWDKVAAGVLVLLATLVLGGGSYLTVDSQRRILTLRVPKRGGLRRSGHPIISGYVFVYLYLLVRDCVQEGLTWVPPGEFIAELSGMSVQPDGEIPIDRFRDRVVPSPERLRELEVSVLRNLDVEIDAFERRRG
jgi:hypothetical protein